ncbi:MAG: RNA ligase (ATP) [Chloroflexota bacterium]|nr:RNA ligase (ATP) [Chloroflexota bacterium]
MTSSFMVPVAAVDEVLPHPNADLLELIHVLGWQLVAAKGQFQVGEKIVYFPPDSVLPFELSERFNVTKYLSKQRIRCVKLRGEPSFGLAMPPDDATWQIGANVAEHYGVTKYEPPLRSTAEDAVEDHPLFPKYIIIENLRNFPHIFEPGEMVVLTEKIHGTSARVGIVEGELMAGSHQLRRKRPENDTQSLYWFPLSLQSVRNLVQDLGQRYHQAVVYGEVYGPKVQRLHYGLKENQLGFRVFDVLVDGKYLEYHEMVKLCHAFEVETVPEIAIIPFDLASIKLHSEGKTQVVSNNAHIREGVVVRSVREHNHPALGRVVLKYVSDSYFLKTNEKDFTDYTEQ